MISNTDLFFSRAKEYQDKRKGIVDEYENRMASLESAKGSKLFDEESKKAEDKRDEALTALKAEYENYFNVCLSAMSKANNGRKMTPPTPEQLSLLQALKMREDLTRREIDRAVNNFKDNAAALGILNDIAHKNGIFGDFTKDCTVKEMSTEAADSVISTLSAELRDFMKYDSTYASRRAQEYKEEHHGATGNEAPLQKRPIFSDKEGCFKILSPGLAGDTLKQFCEAVDG